MATAFEDIKWLAVLAAAASAFIIGGMWYSPFLFQKGWMRENGVSEEDLKKRSPALTFGLALLLSVVMSLNLAFFIGEEGAAFGTLAGFLTGFGWVTMAIGIISLFEGRSLKYVLINGGYMIVALTVMGLILGAWR